MNREEKALTDMPDGADCGSCPLSDAIERRDFLRDAAARALAAIGGVSLFANELSAMSVGFVTGLDTARGKTYAIPATDGVVIDKDESVIVARVADRAYAFSLACPHQNTALRWEARDRRFQCPKHKSRYQPDGVFIEGRATRGLDRFAVQRDGANLIVDLDALYREDKHPAAWAAAFAALAVEK